jgi:hypothetical protein
MESIHITYRRWKHIALQELSQSSNSFPIPCILSRSAVTPTVLSATNNQDGDIASLKAYLRTSSRNQEISFFQTARGVTADHHDQEILFGNVRLGSKIQKEGDHGSFCGGLNIALNQSTEINCHMSSGTRESAEECAQWKRLSKCRLNRILQGCR